MYRYLKIACCFLYFLLSSLLFRRKQSYISEMYFFRLPNLYDRILISNMVMFGCQSAVTESVTREVKAFIYV